MHLVTKVPLAYENVKLIWHEWLNPLNPPPNLLYAYPFKDSLHTFMSIFSICDMRSGIWNRWRADYVNLYLFLTYLGTRSLKTFWSLIILILNYLNFGFEV